MKDQSIGPKVNNCYGCISDGKEKCECLTETIQDQAAELALKHEEGGIINLWPVPDNEDEREYWKKVFKIGYGVGYNQAIEDVQRLLSGTKTIEDVVDWSAVRHKISKLKK